MATGTNFISFAASNGTNNSTACPWTRAGLISLNDLKSTEFSHTLIKWRFFFGQAHDAVSIALITTRLGYLGHAPVTIRIVVDILGFHHRELKKALLAHGTD